MDSVELRNRFKFHPAKDAAIAELHQEVRTHCLELAQFLNGALPEGREKSLAITNLEQVMFWANASIARTASTAQD